MHLNAHGVGMLIKLNKKIASDSRGLRICDGSLFELLVTNCFFRYYRTWVSFSRLNLFIGVLFCSKRHKSGMDIP